MMLRCAHSPKMASRSAAAALALLGVLLLPTAARESAADHGTAPLDADGNPFVPDVPNVYQTLATGTDPTLDPPWDDMIRFLPAGESTLRLFITADGPGAPSSGTTEGTPCLPEPDGLDSDHVCAFSVTLEVSNGEFVSFTPSSTLGAELMSVPSAGTFSDGQTTFSVNYVTSGSPLAPGTFPTGGVHEIGELVVDAMSSGTIVTVIGGDSVRAAVAGAPGGMGPAEPIAPRVIAVPEPGSTLLLVTALAGLAGLHQLRMRRR